MIRYCAKYVVEDLENKMVFIGGPRQVGKTTLAQAILGDQQHYYNWDVQKDRQETLDMHWDKQASLIVFDELHKYAHWKRWMKGVYDTKPEHQNYLVTGSARLDVYRKGGDSLLGRYHYWRLHPFSIDEFPEELSPKEALERLMQVGGFPEPFLKNDLRQARRWRKDRFDKLVREDIRDISRVNELSLMALFIDALRERAGQMVVFSNLARDLQISPKTAQSWLSIVESLYIGFPIYPLSKNIPRAISKPCKVYFYDNADVPEDEGSRFENLVATTLLKRLHFLEDYFGHRCALHYIRDRDGREVDFAVVIDGVLDQLIEVKVSDTTPSKALKYYQKLLKPKQAVQIVLNCQRPFDSEAIRVTNPIAFFRTGPWATPKQ